jgi:hypothetical protein
MNPNWAAENLQTIRTLMERSALYRRALAPVMIFAGVIGIAGGLTGYLVKLETNTGFVLFWTGMAMIALTGALVLVRRQALQDAEPFWSPPTRRVGQALLPAFFAGVMVAVFIVWVSGHSGAADSMLQGIVVLLWSWFYGCALHAAGFFMPRGVRWLGWIFLLAGGILLMTLATPHDSLEKISPHLLMGGIFGGLHLAYGIYLYFTEPKTPAA